VSLSWWNGRLVPAAEVRIDPGDAGFLLGDGLFETLRADAGRPRDVAAHLDRLLAGLDRIGIGLPEDRETLAGAVADVAETTSRPTARLRITITRGSRGGAGETTRLITAARYEPPAADLYRRGVAALLLPQPWIDSRSPLAGLKSLSYQANRLALRRAEAAGAFEALLLNQHGRLAEGARTNVILALPDGLFTPPLADGCLPGTVRRRLLELGAVAERSLAPADLHAARGMLLTNSLIGVLPVGWIDGEEIPVAASAAELHGLWGST
jgi:branched-subunit amino acid aminotransferase/4-amino-4-deoxychorismate lyase